MNFLIILILVSIIIVYGLYKLSNWLLIEQDPVLHHIDKNRSTHKPYFFINEMAEKDLKDQFTLTEITNDAQIFDKATQNEQINNNISIYVNKKIIL